MGDGVIGCGLPVADPRDAERRLWEAFGRGVLVDLRSGDPGTDDPAHADRWDESRRMRAEVVTALLLGAVEPVPGYAAGVRLAGALVEGSVNVRQGVVSCAAKLTDCRFDDEFVLAEARTRTIDLAGSTLETLNAEAAEVSGSLILDRCQVRAINSGLAHIGGQLSLDGAHLTNPGNTALTADQMTVDGSISCREGFQAEGEIRLLAAHISGQLSLNGAHLANPGKPAVAADGMTLDGSMLCDEGFQTEGEIRLLAAHISGQLSLKGAHLTNPGNAALHAYQMTVDGSMFCDEGFQAKGEIRLQGAHIGGLLSLDGAHLANPGSIALNADGITVDSGMFSQNGFHVEGIARLAGAHIGGALSLNGAHLANPGSIALNADGITVDVGMFFLNGFHAEGTVRLALAHIGGQLVFRDAAFSNPSGVALNCHTVQADSLWLDGAIVTGTVDLTSAQVRTLHDAPSGWPEQMRLDGFTYDDLEPFVEARGPSGRLVWLAHAEIDYRAQPYEQLAAYYRRLGHDEEARRVLVGKQRRRRAGLGRSGKTIGYALDALVGYGYRPARAFAWLVTLIVVGSVYFTFNRPAAIEPTQHPHFQPVLYAADLVIPIVNLGQADTWALAGAAQWVAAVLTALGWILATAVVAGITRVLTRT